MPAQSPSLPHKIVPPFRVHIGTGQGYVNLDGQRHYLGRADKPEALAKYKRLVSEWAANGYRLPVPKADSTIVELAAAYKSHLTQTYRDPEGNPTPRCMKLRTLAETLARVYGETNAKDFGPRQLKAVRQHWIDAGLVRTTINENVRGIIAIFRFGVENEMVDVTIYQTLKAIEPLRRGRGIAKESRKVLPVSMAVVEQTIPHLQPTIRAVVKLQLYTGARPSEILGLRGTDIDMTGDVWTAVLTEHKNAHGDQPRTLFFGPRAQSVLLDRLGKKPIHEFLFSPADTVIQMHAMKAANRVTPLSCGNRPGTNVKAHPKCTPGEHYDTGTYRRCIQRACLAHRIEDWRPHHPVTPCLALVHHLTRDDRVQPENILMRQTFPLRPLLHVPKRRETIQHLPPRSHGRGHGCPFLQRPDFFQRERIAFDGR